MLTTRREIRNKQDRFGAFERNSTEKAVELGLNNVEINSLSEIRSVETSTAFGTESTTSNPIGGVSVGKKKLRVTPPTENKKSTKVVAGIVSKEKMRTRNIVMIVAYCLVVVALVAVIALNANALTGITAKNDALTQSVETLSREQIALTTEMNALSDPTRLANLASKMELTETSATVVQMNVPKLAPVLPKTVQTNWFDQLCDAVSGVFGG